MYLLAEGRPVNLASGEVTDIRLSFALQSQSANEIKKGDEPVCIFIGGVHGKKELTTIKALSKISEKENLIKPLFKAFLSRVQLFNL